MAASIFATDLYRWVGASANIGLLAIAIAFGRSVASEHGRLLWLLPFTLLAPLGSDPPDRPFPVHQFVLERLLR